MKQKIGGLKETLSRISKLKLFFTKEFILVVLDVSCVYFFFFAHFRRFNGIDKNPSQAGLRIRSIFGRILRIRILKPDP